MGGGVGICQKELGCIPSSNGMESSDELWGSSTVYQKGLGSFVKAYRKNGPFHQSSVQNFVSEDAERVVYSFLIYLFLQISLYSGGF